MADEKSPKELSSGKPVVVEREKMSKSRFNGINPNDVLNRYSDLSV